MECTTGAKIFNDGQSLIVFKNKDFRVKSHSDELSFNHSHAFGVRGVNLRIRKPAGFSIGVNQYGLVAVNSNILATLDSPYDLITERIVLEAKTVDEAVNICKQEVQGRIRYQWCNMVVATPKQLVAIELTSSEFATSQSNDYLVRTNHHLILKTNEAIIEADPDKEKQNIINSKIRLKEVDRVLKVASEVEDIFSLLKSHPEAAICRHGRSSIQDLSYTTVYSYLIVINIEKRLKIVFNVAKGPPCQHTFGRFNLNFPLTTEKEEQIKQYYPF
ncbi:MAG: carcinine hydrolase/isopenicillin-N N-acyltransferase family protein [Candidatus Hodarchaeota archaeon]